MRASTEGLLLCEHIENPKKNSWLGLLLTNNRVVWLCLPSDWRASLGHIERLNENLRKVKAACLTDNETFLLNGWKFQIISRREENENH